MNFTLDGSADIKFLEALPSARGEVICYTDQSIDTSVTSPADALVYPAFDAGLGCSSPGWSSSVSGLS